MTDVTVKSALRLSNKKVHGRLENVIADLLRRQLYVPNAFLNPKIPGIAPVDVLAADRAGSGDLHAVEIKILTTLPTRSWLRTLIKPIKTLPFHYKYLALPGFSNDLSDAKRFEEYTELLMNWVSTGLESSHSTTWFSIYRKRSTRIRRFLLFDRNALEFAAKS